MCAKQGIIIACTNRTCFTRSYFSTVQWHVQVEECNAHRNRQTLLTWGGSMQGIYFELICEILRYLLQNVRIQDAVLRAIHNLIHVYIRIRDRRKRCFIALRIMYTIY